MASGVEEVSVAHSRVLSSGIYQLLLQRRMLDVTITCGGEAIMAHKAVLVSYSKFLDTVFSGQGDDCDVLNMDNLGLEFEAIRAVIFFMYKGVVDTDRCGDAAFQQAAKVLCVDTNTQPESRAEPGSSKPEPKPIAPAVVALQETHADTSVEQSPETSQTKPDTNTTQIKVILPHNRAANRALVKPNRMVDAYTMTEQHRITKLSRESQTDYNITGLGDEEELLKKKRKPRNAFIQTNPEPEKLSKESQTVPQILNDLGLSAVAGNVVKPTETEKITKIKTPAKRSLTAVEPSRRVTVNEETIGDKSSTARAVKTPAQLVASKLVDLDKSDNEANVDRSSGDALTPVRASARSSGDALTPVRASARKRKLTEKMKETIELERELKNKDFLQITSEKYSDEAERHAPAHAEDSTDSPTPKRGRGRPRKDSSTTPTVGVSKSATPKVTTPKVSEVMEDEPPLKRGRGRPRKSEGQTPKPSKNGNASLSQAKVLNRTSKVMSVGNVHIKQEDVDVEGEAQSTPEYFADHESSQSDGDQQETEDEADSKVWDTIYAKGEGSSKKKRLRARSDLHSETKRHLWRRSLDGMYQCLLCDWKRESTRSLTVHLRIHLGEKPFECEHCGKRFRTSDKRRDHVRIHTGERPFSCPICSRAFSTRKNMARHRAIHTKDPSKHKPFLCEECGKPFYSMKRMATHMTRCHILGKNRHACHVEECDYSTGDKKTLLYHLAEVHGHAIPADLVTVCTVCGTSVRKTSLRMHMMIHAAKNIHCEHCPFVTQYVTTLKGHMRRLHGVNIDGTPAVRPFQCDICPEAYFSRQQLKYHKMRHMGEKPHFCPICDFRTVDKGSMNMHIRTHTGVTPFRCHYCGKQFKQSSALSWHVKTVHLGIRRYSCRQCNKSYVNKKDLRAHKLSKHLYLKPYSCTHCTYTCTKKDYMITHIEKLHGAKFVPQELKESEPAYYEDSDDDVENSSLNTLTKDLSKIDDSQDIPMLIVPENTMKDLLVTDQQNLDITMEYNENPEAEIGESFQTMHILNRPDDGTEKVIINITNQHGSDADGSVLIKTEVGIDQDVATSIAQVIVSGAYDDNADTVEQGAQEGNRQMKVYYNDEGLEKEIGEGNTLESGTVEIEDVNNRLVSDNQDVAHGSLTAEHLFSGQQVVYVQNEHGQQYIIKQGEDGQLVLEQPGELVLEQADSGGEPLMEQHEHQQHVGEEIVEEQAVTEHAFDEQVMEELVDEKVM